MLNTHINVHIEGKVKISPRFYRQHDDRRAFATLAIEDQYGHMSIYINTLSDIDALITALNVIRHDFEAATVADLSNTSI